MENQNTNTMELTTEFFEYIHEQMWSECDHLHQEWLDCEDGSVDRYTEDDVHDNSLDLTHKYLLELGYSEEQINTIYEELWG